MEQRIAWLVNMIGTLLLGAVVIISVCVASNYVHDVAVDKLNGYCARVDDGAFLCLSRHDESPHP